MKDWRGVEVKQGDTVIYATRRGSSLEIVHGEVLGLNSNDVAAVRIVKRRYMWADSRKVVNVSGTYMTVVAGLPEATVDTA